MARDDCVLLSGSSGFLRQYQVDAFADRPFTGNPAAVCRLDEWPEDAFLQAIAEENNLSETAFFVPSAKGFHLRWFTPVREVDLCGHATLATAHVIFSESADSATEIVFETRSGDLPVRRCGDRIEMDFPAIPLVSCPCPELLQEALGTAPCAVFVADIYVAVLDSEAQVRSLKPDLGRLTQLDKRAVCVTAPGEQADFVSRYFAPKMGVPEDPVTGSAHCKLVPYWAQRLGKCELLARQLSKRGGELSCSLRGERVLIAGKAVTVMTSALMVLPEHPIQEPEGPNL